MIKMENKIKHLLQNPNLHKTPVGKGPCGEEVLSNCHGTVLYLLNKEKYITGPPMEKNTYPLNWILQAGNPGHIDGNLMKKILEKNFKRINWPKKGDVVGFWENDWLVHSAVFLDFVNGKTIIFNQKDIDQPFEISTVETYLDCHSDQNECYYTLLSSD